MHVNAEEESLRFVDVKGGWRFGLFDYDKNYNHDYFWQYCNHDYLTRYEWAI